MPPLTTHALAQFYIDQGRFYEALAQVRTDTVRSEPQSDLSYIGLRSELLQAVGQNVAATREATVALRAPRRSATVESRVHAVLGLVSADRGDLRGALRHLNTSVKLAAGTDDRPQLCRAQLHLMPQLAGMSGPQAVRVLVPQIEQTLASCNEPMLTARFHILLGELEGKRGVLSEAERHLRVADCILKASPNLWLQAALSLDRFAIAWLRSDIGTADDQIQCALTYANQSGHLRTRVAAIGNAAVFQFHTGDLGRAGDLCRHALELSADLGEIRSNLLDTYAQVRLAEGNLIDCEAHLQEIEDATKEQRAWPSWYQVATYSTRVRVLQQQKRWSHSLELVAEGIKAAAGQSDRFYLPLLRVLEADALIALGDLKGAAESIFSAEEAYDGAAPAVAGEIDRVRGTLLARMGRFEQALPCFQRAFRVLSVVGGILPRIDAVRSYLAAREGMDRPIAAAQQAEPWNLAPFLAEMNTVSLKPPGDDRVIPPQAGLVDAAALLELGVNPLLLGQESFATLAATGAASAAALVAAKNGACDVLASSGWTAAEARAAMRSAESLDRMSLGEAQSSGYHLIIKPYPDIESRHALTALRKIIHATLALERFRQEQQARASLLPEEVSIVSDGVVHVSDATVNLFATARQVALSDLPVLIIGETGTGKELLARTIHRHSKRAEQIFLPYNCSGVSRDMIDSQLFGHRRGSFTGAQEHAPGVIRAASGGTLLLDEIGELDRAVQPKLLRFLETSEIHPLGEARPIKVNVRVVAATNADLDQMVRDGQFREDLFYRLNVIRLRVPPLRERQDEIPPLAHHFLNRSCAEHQKHNIRIADDTLKAFLAYDWPGNVRQLANEMRRLVALNASHTTLTPDQLSPEIRAALAADPAPVAMPLGTTNVSVRLDQTLASAVTDLERAMILRALSACHGRVDRAARMLGLSRKGLFLKRKRLEIDRTLAAAG